ncbi:MAG: branched-chain amino acid ABC transporter permease [Solirubrobacterales bacterium]|nr:branched-chain amino acid ABC transporter permease [Solirubrobacterales bacterium]
MSTLRTRLHSVGTRDRIAIGLTIGAIFLLWLAPSQVSRYDRYLLTTLFLYVALAQAWNIIGGIGGQFSLMHSAFVGGGAYTATMLLNKTGLPLLECVLLSGVVAAVMAAVAAVALLRLRGVYFAVGSLAVAVAVQIWMTTWNYTGATRGVSVPLGALPTPNGLYEEALAIAALAIAAAAIVKHSRFGLGLMSVRDDEDAAAGMGINGSAVKLAAFTLSAFLTGLAGAVIALQQISIEPFSAFGLSWTISMIVMCIVGGLGTVTGPIVGAIVVYYGLQVQLQNYATLGTAITGVVMIALVRFAPDGVIGLIRAGADHAIAWRHRSRTPPATAIVSSSGEATAAPAVAIKHETGVIPKP